MRYRITDLLWLTLGMSAYAAVIGACFRSSGYAVLSTGWSSTLISLALLAWMLGGVAMNSLRQMKRNGASTNVPVAVIHLPHRPWRHLAVFLVFALMCFTGSLSSHPRMSLSWLIIAAVFHLSAEAASTIVFDERGMMTRGRLHTWDEWDITLKTGPPRLVCWRNPNRERMAPEVFAVPPGAEDEVREALRHYAEASS